MRVAVVGAGPKGLHAVAALLRGPLAGRGLQIDCFDPQPPGQGGAYAEDQPVHLRLNVHPRVLHLPPLDPFDQWLSGRGIEPAGDVPRREVGHYLREATDALVCQNGAAVVRFHRTAVTGLERHGECWTVRHDGGELPADEVLLATGHAPDHDGALRHLWAPVPGTTLVPGVYPVDEYLTTRAVPPASTVAVRGGALTFIDCALALTEGRVRADWPARILPVTRSGALLLAKPAVALDPGLTALLHEHAKSLGELLPDEPNPFDATLRATVDAASTLLAAQGRECDAARAAVEAALATGFDPDLPVRGRARAALARSIAVATRDRALSPSWALGRAWAALYPTLVAGLSHRRPEPDEWARFATASAVLERFTYGPPLRNARRLEALLCTRDGPHRRCTGVVCLDWVERGVSLGESIAGIGDDEWPDVVVDAVLPPPGAASARTPLVDALLSEGLVRVAAPRRGLEVTRDAQCVGADGRPTPGLSAIGRLTEDVVIGHDTLSVTMHDEIDRWAARLAAGREE